MIVQNQDEQLLVIRQTDHALLAGFFARQWGNDLFTRPEPFESFCLAAEEHDNGWREWELEPSIDPSTFQPYTFMSIPTEEHMALYERGLSRLVAADAYAGLLACTHIEQLYDHTRATIPGYSAKYVKSSDMKLVHSFIERLRLQKLRLKVYLRAQQLDQKPFIDDKWLEANVQRLEAVDRLSLYFCAGPQDASLVESVPVDDRGSDADLVVTPLPGNVFSLSPFPFRRDPFEFGIQARYIPKRRYSDDSELQRALTSAPYSLIKFTLRSVQGQADSFSAWA